VNDWSASDQQDTENKSEIQQLTDRVSAAEKLVADANGRAEKAEAQSLRDRIQAKHKISDEDAALFLTAADEAGLIKQAEGLAARETDRKKNGPRVPKEGNASEPKDEGMREFARGLFQTGD